MTQPIMPKFFISTLLAGATLMHTTATLVHPRIASIENRSADTASIEGSRVSHTIKPAIHKRLAWPLFIPFISIDKYRDQFIAGDPYFPQGAIVVTTIRGKYAIWRDETGIVCALEFVPGTVREECLPVPLFKHTNQIASQNIAQSLLFLLSINKQGELNLIKQNS